MEQKIIDKICNIDLVKAHPWVVTTIVANYSVVIVNYAYISSFNTNSLYAAILNDASNNETKGQFIFLHCRINNFNEA